MEKTVQRWERRFPGACHHHDSLKFNSVRKQVLFLGPSVTWIAWHHGPHATFDHSLVGAVLYVLYLSVQDLAQEQIKR